MHFQNISLSLTPFIEMDRSVMMLAFRTFVFLIHRLYRTQTAHICNKLIENQFQV